MDCGGAMLAQTAAFLQNVAQLLLISGTISVCITLSLQGHSGDKDHATKYVAHKYDMEKSGLIRTKSNASGIPRRLCDSETVSLQNGRGTSTAYLSAWNKQNWEIRWFTFEKSYKKARNLPPISKS